MITRILGILPVLIIASLMLWLLLGANCHLFPAPYFPFLPPKGPTYNGRNLKQWLQILKTDANSALDPLRIINASYDEASQVFLVEVPLSYDLLKKYDFFERNGKLGMIAEGQGLLTSCYRATNGNCILRGVEPEPKLGANHIQISFYIYNPASRDYSLHSESKVVTCLVPNKPGQPP